MIASLCVAAALLLVASGLAKLGSPAPTATMLVALAPRLVRRSWTLRPIARTAGATEIAVGAAVLAFGGRGPALLLASCWLVFTAVALRLLRSGRPVSCGCFGSSGAPIGVPHVVLDVAGLVIAIAAVIAPPAAAGGLLDATVLVALIALAQSALLAWLGYLSITALPALLSARHLVESA